MANNDVNFMYSLYSVSKEKTSSRVDFLFYSIASLIIILITWANIAKVDELTSGEGKVIPSSKIQTVQYLDGGIIADILVKEGEHVSQGQALLKIDITRFQATFEETQENLLSLKAKKTRLTKELDVDYTKNLPKLHFSKELEKKAKQYIQSEQIIFKNKFYERKNSLKVISLQYRQKLQELVELKAKRKELAKALEFIKEQFKTISQMVKSGSKSRVELIDKKKEYNTAKGQLEATKLAIPRSKLSIEESNASLNEKSQTIKSDISIELQKTIAEIQKIISRLVTDNDKLEKTIIKSPTNGIIKQININTIGAVIKSGIDLIEIVPDSDILLVEAKIDPKDIAFINPQSKVKVKLTAYDFSIYGGLNGKIVEISADSIKDKESKNNKSYYKVVVKTNKNYLEHNGEKLIIIPGMIAKVDIVTGRKTIMDFFLKPILKVKNGALHER